MSALVGNPEDRFSHEAQFGERNQERVPGRALKGVLGEGRGGSMVTNE